MKSQKLSEIFQVESSNIEKWYYIKIDWAYIRNAMLVNIWKSNNVTYHVNRRNEKNHMTLSLDV